MSGIKYLGLALSFWLWFLPDAEGEDGTLPLPFSSEQTQKAEEETK